MIWGKKYNFLLDTTAYTETFAFYLTHINGGIINANRDQRYW